MAIALRARVLAAAFVVSSISGGAVAQTAVSVGVNAASDLATIPAPAFGLNTAVWDANLNDGAVPGLLQQAGVAMLRYPGGSTSDVYNWQSNSIVPGQGSYANPSNNFDAFMRVARNVGAQPMLTINYGSNTRGNAGGDPSFAASWVRYANVTKGYGVKYWEIGNEVYGNGFYGAQWETDLHAKKDPTTYGKNVALFVSAMKAVDPTIRVGAVLTAPGRWPDGQQPDWNSAVLAQCGSVIDFVIVHWYPQEPWQETDAGLLASPQHATLGVSAMMTKLKALIAQYGGGRNIEVMVTETNSVTYNPGKQTLSIVNAMFIADNMVSWIENGAANVSVWGLHNGAVWGNASPSLFGSSAYGDYGILSNGQSGEPAANTPFPTYYGMKMASLLGRPGDTLVRTTSSSALLTAHAVRQASGALALLLINKDPANAATANVALSGYTPSAGATVYSYTPTSGAITSANLGAVGASFPVSVPAYSMAAVVLGGAATPPTPGFTLAANPSSLTLTQGASGAATVTVSPSGGFGGAVNFAASGVPAGVTATFSPASSATGTTLTLAASPTAQTGTGVFTITGTSGALSASTALALTVNAPPSPGGPVTFTGRAVGSPPWYYENDVTFTASAPITALSVTITVAASNVTYNGAYNTIGGQITQAFTSGANLVYSFALASGQTINAGAGTFAAQMNGNGVPHDVTGDLWSVTYTAGGATYTQAGHF